jgi:hypothetical protein
MRIRFSVHTGSSLDAQAIPGAANNPPRSSNEDILRDQLFVIALA